MPKGYHDRVAFVDLSTGKVWYESFGEAFWRRYLGGGPSPPTFSSGTCPRGPTPWAPRTPSSSPPGSSPEPPSPARGGTPWPPKAPSPGGTGTRRAAASSGRSSRTRAWTPWWFWARRKLPSTSTWKGEVALHPAVHLWGKDPLEVEALIKEAHGGNTRVAQIGLAGENRVLTANVIHDLAHFAGRGAWGRSWGPKGSRRSPPGPTRRPFPPTTTPASSRSSPGAWPRSAWTGRRASSPWAPWAR